MFYKALIRPIFFLFDPEWIHHVVLRCLELAGKFRPLRHLMNGWWNSTLPGLSRQVAGITFPNPVGLAAGFDKDGRLLNVIGSLGFGYVEIGTTTPRPQPGNDKPRMFRLPKDQALINRMGFNNEGLDAVVQRLRTRKSTTIVGGNIGRNKVTSNADALGDYLLCAEALYPYVDYFVLNVSSPNTPGLRELQDREPLQELLRQVLGLLKSKPVVKPVFLKIAPDLTDEQLADVVDILKSTGTDGVIATNTTISRSGLQTPTTRLEEIGAGGLSGLPLKSRALEVLRFLRLKLGPGYPIISVGGIMSPADAVERLAAGADLIQVYTGFIYEGPGFIRRINREIHRVGNPTQTL